MNALPKSWEVYFIKPLETNHPVIKYLRDNCNTSHQKCSAKADFKQFQK